MIFSCMYDTKSGKILAWTRSSSLVSAASTLRSEIGGEDGPRPNTKCALVSKFPSEILEHDERWPLDHCIVVDKRVGSVEVGIV